MTAEEQLLAVKDMGEHNPNFLSLLLQHPTDHLLGMVFSYLNNADVWAQF
jgi:peptide deformylase